MKTENKVLVGLLVGILINETFYSYDLHVKLLVFMTISVVIYKAISLLDKK